MTYNLEEILKFNQLTEKQKEVVTCENTPILVSASAGSGKTLALCNRILFKILNPKNEISTENLLIVSFTKAAANEIYNRLKKNLTILIEKFPKQTFFKKQLSKISQNNITTIDSFCSNFLKNNFEQAKISPNFKIGSEIEFFKIKQKILNNIFENEKEKNLENFTKLSTYFNIKNDEDLKTAILKIFEKSRTNPFPEQFLINLYKKYETPTNLKQNKNLTDLITKEIFDKINSAKILLLNSVNYMDDQILRKNFAPVFEQNAFNLNNLLKKLENSNYEEFFKPIQKFKFESLPRYNKKNNNFDQNLAEYIKTKFLNPAKKLINSINPILINDEQFLSDQKKQKPIIKQLVHICLTFSKKLEEHKKLTNTLEFSDLLIKTIKLLAKPKNSNNESINLTPLGNRIKTNFSEVLVDEFQDINKPQELLFKILSNNGEKLFVVGDLKQSIYRFRQADPEIFLNYKKNFKKQNKTIIELQNNFRSHNEITNSINFLFGQIMSEQFGGTNYEKTDTLISNSDFVQNKNLYTELHILTPTEENYENEENSKNSLKNEMKHVAWQIKNLIQNNFKINEDGKIMSCKPKHFAILLRSEKQASEILTKELSNLNIPYNTEIKNQLLNAYEIKILVAMLKIINNPLDEVAFCAVAKSPIFNFSNTELAQIKNKCDQNSFFLAFNNYKSKKCENFLKILFNFRQKSKTTTISQLVQTFCNLEIFNKLIFNYEKQNNQTLDNINNFINTINELEQEDSDLNLNKFLELLKTAKTESLNLNSRQQNSNFDNNSNAVKIMTIHKSKGLEFPIVIIPMCSKKFNKQDFNFPLIISNKLGIGLKHSNPKTLNRYNTMQFNCVLADEKNESTAEELRLLYVAMTRAKQKLILVASDYDKKFKSIITPNSKILPASFCRTKTSFYDWILASYTRHKNSPFFNKKNVEFNKKEFQCNIVIKNKFEKNLNNELNKQKLNTELVKKLTNKLNSMLNFKIIPNKLSKISTKMSVSEITKETINNFSFKKLSFDNNQSIQIERGIAMHKFLQHADFKKTKQNIDKEIKRLIQQEFITKKQASYIDLKQIRNFLNSKIFNLIENSTSIEREKNFIFEMPANKINKKAPAAKIVVQGTIDLIIKNKNKIIIVDYKTDRTTNQNLKMLYSKQLKIYRHAMEKLTQNSSISCLIYSLYSNSIVEIEKN